MSRVYLYKYPKKCRNRFFKEQLNHKHLQICIVNTNRGKGRQYCSHSFLILWYSLSVLSTESTKPCVRLAERSK